jgi:Leu/Phe-tRNA-protein transferase
MFAKQSEADAEAAAKVAAELGALELKLLDVELENEALRAQLVTSGIEPQVIFKHV